MRLAYDKVRIVLYVAMLLVPFTELRFGFVGIGEVLFALAFLMLLVLNGGNIRRNPALSPLVRFWSVYLAVISIGFFCNVLILGHVSGTYFGAAFDFLSYLVVLSVVRMLGDQRLYTGSSPQEFFKGVFLLWGVAFTILYLLSLRASEIYGLPLRYYDYFSPLVENLHQAAMITSAMSFVMLYQAFQPGLLIRRSAYIILGWLFFLMAIESGSTKAYIGVFAGGFVSAFYIFLRKLTLGHKNIKLAAYCFVIIFVVAVVIAKLDTVVQVATTFFRENDGSAARENLYAIGLEHGLRSFLFGYGPGPHISLFDGYYSDAHNTLLTVFLQGGVVAILLFVATIFRLAFRVSIPSFLLGAIVAIAMYMLGGDILRRLPIWIIVVGIIYFSQEPFRGSVNVCRQGSGIRNSVKAAPAWRRLPG